MPGLNVVDHAVLMGVGETALGALEGLWTQTKHFALQKISII